MVKSPWLRIVEIRNFIFHVFASKDWKNEFVLESEILFTNCIK